MRITHELIRTRAKESSLQSIQVLDLSRANTCVIEKLNACTKLQSLDLSYNNIESIPSTIQQCPQLWSLNLKNNKVQNLDGLSRFVAFGLLDLSNNNLSWPSLAKIQHLHILDLRLHGNEALERDPYYRIHVVDVLPNVWMLDGRLITSAERIQVKAFFDESSLSERPVRHKLTAKPFVPTTEKSRHIDGIFGEKVIHLMKRFSNNEPINIDLDKRRLYYLCENLVYDIKPLADERLRIERKQSKEELLDNSFLMELLALRKSDTQRSNILLILLLASVQFPIPSALLHETMQVMKLDTFGTVQAVNLFSMTEEKKIFVMSVLLSAVKIERIENKNGGFYDKLYLCMNYLLTDFIKSDSAKKSESQANLLKQYKSLLAAEVVLLMCYVPYFSDYLMKEPGIMALVKMATNDRNVEVTASALLENLKFEKVSEEEQMRTVAQYIQSSVIMNLSNLSGSSAIKLHPEEKVFLKRALPQRPSSSPVRMSSYHSKGRSSPQTSPPRVFSAKPSRSKLPDVGETVLTSPQALAKIVSLPQPGIALVLLDMVPVHGGMESRVDVQQRYAFIDLNDITWDSLKGYWRPKGSVGSRVSVHHQVGDAGLVNLKRVRQKVEDKETKSREIAVNVPAAVMNHSASIVSNSAAEELISLIPRSESPILLVKDKVESEAEFVPPTSRENIDESLEYNDNQNNNLIINSCDGLIPTSEDISLNHQQPVTSTLGDDTKIPEKKENGAIDDEELSVTDRERLIQTVLAEEGQDCFVIADRSGPLRRVKSAYTPRKPKEHINMAPDENDAEKDRVCPSPILHNSEAYDSYSTPYMKQKAHEWNLKIKGPDETPGVSVKWANVWMAGGKNLYKEEVKKRPKSAHIPGWKEELMSDVSGRPYSSSNAFKHLTMSVPRKGSGRSWSSSKGSYERQLNHSHGGNSAYSRSIANRRFGEAVCHHLSLTSID